MLVLEGFPVGLQSNDGELVTKWIKMNTSTLQALKQTSSDLSKPQTVKIYIHMDGAAQIKLFLAVVRATPSLCKYQ